MLPVVLCFEFGTQHISWNACHVHSFFWKISKEKQHQGFFNVLLVLLCKGTGFGHELKGALVLILCQ